MPEVRPSMQDLIRDRRRSGFVAAAAAAARGGAGGADGAVDEAAGSVPEAMEAISGQLARQGHPLKGFDRLLQRYRQRRHEADSVVAACDGAPGAPGAAAVAPGPGGTAVERFVNFSAVKDRAC